MPRIELYPRIIAFLGYTRSLIETKTIGGQIYRYGTENGFSYRNLAKDTLVDLGTLASWERNETRPST